MENLTVMEFECARLLSQNHILTDFKPIFTPILLRFMPPTLKFQSWQLPRRLICNDIFYTSLIFSYANDEELFTYLLNPFLIYLYGVEVFLLLSLYRR
jgi:hypothetical protein